MKIIHVAGTKGKVLSFYFHRWVSSEMNPCQEFLNLWLAIFISVAPTFLDTSCRRRVWCQTRVMSNTDTYTETSTTSIFLN